MNSLYRENEHDRLVKATADRLDKTTAEQLAKSGIGRGRLMAAEARGDMEARAALRAYRETTRNSDGSTP